MSGSFHPPGEAYVDKPICLSKMSTKESYLAEISPVVLHELPTDLAQIQTDSSPHEHIEKKIALPDLLRASLMGGYLSFDDILLL